MQRGGDKEQVIWGVWQCVKGGVRTNQVEPYWIRHCNWFEVYFFSLVHVTGEASISVANWYEGPSFLDAEEGPISSIPHWLDWIERHAFLNWEEGPISSIDWWKRHFVPDWGKKPILSIDLWKRHSVLDWREGPISSIDWQKRNSLLDWEEGSISSAWQTTYCFSLCCATGQKVPAFWNFALFSLPLEMVSFSHWTSNVF